MSQPPFSKGSLGSTSTGGPFDARIGRGYGSIDPQYHLHRGMGDAYPYNMTDKQEEEHEEIENTETDIDEEGEKAIHKKADGPHGFDNAGFGHDDPFHFVDGATKLTELFDILDEIAVGSSIAPIPNLNKNRQGSIGGTKTGTVRGDGSSNMPKTMPRSDIWAGPSTYDYLHNEDTLDNYQDTGVDSDIFDPNDHELYLTETYLRKWIQGIIIQTQKRV